MQSTFTVLTTADYVTTQWSGGTTTQLTIAPQGAVYAERDFLWRVSSATVELDESDFTALPDYKRLISTVRGDMTLSHNGGAALTLHPGDVHAFDGGDDTHSVGRCTDFNLMLRKGRADGSMSSLRLDTERRTLVPEAGTEQLLLFCATGNVEIRRGDEHCRLAAGEALCADGSAPLTLEGDSGTLLMLAQMRRL
ncbi:MAG: HutD family protein [Oscillospiraceae bacterium]|nr:HutD family protein [Oscillospiraceae bacterium]